MKRKVRIGRIVAVVVILAVAALLVVAGSGCAGWGWGWGHGKSCSYYQGSCSHNNYGGGCGYGGGCQTGVYIHYNVSGCGKCGQTCWPVINPPERPDCDDFCNSDPDTCSYNQSAASGGGFAFDVPELSEASLGLEKPAIPTIP